MNYWDIIPELQYYTFPFDWIKIKRCFNPKDAFDLANTFPKENFAKSIGKDSRYSLYERTLIDQDLLCFSNDLSQIWQSFAIYMLSTDYKKTVEIALRKQIVHDSKLRVRLYRYSNGDWMNPHTDPPDRLTTHLIYLNPEWKDDFGGQLVILESNSLDSISEVVPPHHNTGVLFCPSEKSYHAVTPMSNENEIERLVIISQFIKE